MVRCHVANHNLNYIIPSCSLPGVPEAKCIFYNELVNCQLVECIWANWRSTGACKQTTRTTLDLMVYCHKQM